MSTKNGKSIYLYKSVNITFSYTLRSRINRGCLNKQGGEGGSEKSVEYNRQGVGVGRNRGFFVSFDPNDVNVSKFVCARLKLQFIEREKSVEAM